MLGVYCLPSFARSKQYYKSTGTLCSYKTNNCPCSLNTESYCVYAEGAWGTDLNSEYLTDSTSFRIYLGTYDKGGERINVTCKGDSITVEKISDKLIHPNFSRAIALEKKSYSLKALKRAHVFE